MKKKYAGGTIYSTKHGTFLAQVNHCYHKYKLTLDTEAQAKAWIEMTVARLERGDKSVDLDVRDAMRAAVMLPPNVSLCDAARAYLLANPQGVKAVTIEIAVADFLADKTSAGRRGRSLEDLKSRTGCLARDMKGRQVADITAKDLRDWLDSGKKFSTNRANYRRAWSNFFGWCVRERLCAGNP
ncbi:MAG: hypothetical protein WC655_27200, partial [Candidatus Hydrogenedentales bacterium]